MQSKAVKIRKPYEPRVRLEKTFHENTMAKQSFKDECDINTIMAKYEKTGLITHVRDVQGAYGDFSNVLDYQLSLNQVIEAQAAFDRLPAQVRKRFGNQPSQLMEFLEDAANRDEAVKLGLVEPASTPPQPTSAAAEPPPSNDPPAKPATA